MLDRLHREHRGEAAVGERERAHVGDVGLAVLPRERIGIEVDARRSPGGEQVVAVADAAAEIEDAARRQEPGAELVGGHVTLPGRVEAARGGDDALAGDSLRRRRDHGAYFLDGSTWLRCRINRPAAHRVLTP